MSFKRRLLDASVAPGAILQGLEGTNEVDPNRKTVRCDGCGVSVEASGPTEAIVQTLEQVGWMFYQPTMGSKCLCPGCAACLD